MEDLPYSQLVGSLLYASCMSRPDVAYETGVLARFMQDPSFECWIAALRVAIYLHCTREKQLVYKKNIELPHCIQTYHESIRENHGLHAYCDSSWGIPNPVNGYIVFMSGAPISFQSKSSKVIAMSSAEAEYSAAWRAAQELAFIRNLLGDLGCTIHGRITLFCDNKSAISNALDIGITARNKHYERFLHYVREQVFYGKIKLYYLPTADMLGDRLTKSFGPSAHAKWMETLYS